MDRPTEEYSRVMQREFPDLRLEPEERICPMYDQFSMSLIPGLDWDVPLWRLPDNFVEEHIM